jgi:hypothetical protein
MIDPVNLSDLLPKEFDEWPEVLRAAVPEIAAQVHQRIVDRAQDELNSSRQPYIAGMMIESVANNMETTSTIVLEGLAANLVEHGWAGGDLKPVILSKPGAKHSRKTGTRYAVVRLDRHTNMLVDRDLESPTVLGDGVYRTITDRQSGWIHPGVPGHQFFSDARADVVEVAGTVIEQALKEAR